MGAARGGAMTAVIGLTAEKIKSILEENSLNNISIACENTHTQIVISGDIDHIEKAEKSLKKANAKMIIPLPVSGEFHSFYMLAAQEKFETYLKTFDFSKPKIPVISNYTAKPYLAMIYKKTYCNKLRIRFYGLKRLNIY